MWHTEPIVFVVDDDENVRKSLGRLIETIGYHVRVFPGAHEFLAAYDPAEPGCLVLDIRMPGMSGLGLQEKLKEHGDRLPIIFITGHGDVSTVVEAFRGGAVDFIEKPFSDQKLLESINQAIDISQENHCRRVEIEDVKERLDSLTPREHQIMEQVVEGNSNKTIAFALALSPKTVDFHRGNIMEKMGVNSAVQLTKKVVEVSRT